MEQTRQLLMMSLFSCLAWKTELFLNNFLSFSISLVGLPFIFNRADLQGALLQTEQILTFKHFNSCLDSARSCFTILLLRKHTSLLICCFFLDRLRSKLLCVAKANGGSTKKDQVAICNNLPSPLFCSPNPIA